MTDVTFNGSKAGRPVDVVFCNSGQKDWEFPLGVKVEGVPETVVKKLQEDEYYSGYKFSVTDKSGASEPDPEPEPEPEPVQEEDDKGGSD